MSQLFLSISIFIIAHIIPSYAPLRMKMASALGERVFMSLYGVLSLVLFIWLLNSYLNAPYIEIWMMQDWMRYPVLVVMFVVCLLFVCAFSQPNPFSLGIGGKNFDPNNPGIVGVTKHPAFVAFALWALVHMVPNGDIASLLFFGLMAGLSLYGPHSLNRKRQLSMGVDQWQCRVDEIKEGWPRVGWKRWLVTLILYVALLHAHGPVIGVVPYSW
jgi:uncharacterized membrane protein